MEKVNKYANGKIYKIISDQENSLVYIGSTTEKYLSNRFVGHRSRFKKWTVGERKATSLILFEKYGVGNCKIILIESYPCETKDELRQREQYWIDNIECVNKQRAYVADQDKKKHKCEASKRYRNNNLAKTTLAKKQYDQEHKESIKAYYENNKEQKKQDMKRYYQANKERLKEKRRKNLPISNTM